MERGKTTSVIIPKKSQQGFFEIRMESIGGLGANVAGKILADEIKYKIYSCADAIGRALATRKFIGIFGIDVIVTDEGRIILIDEDPSFVYNRAVKILGSLPREKKFFPG